MRRLLVFAAAAGMAYLAARALVRSGGDAVDDPSPPPLDAVALPERAPAAFPETGRSWSPPPPSVEKATLRSLRVADVPAPGRVRTPEEAERAAVVDAQARAPRGNGGIFFGGDQGSGSTARYVAGGSRIGRRDEGTADSVSAMTPEPAGALPEASAVPGRPGEGAKTATEAPRQASGGGDEASWTGRTAGVIEAAKSLGTRTVDSAERAFLNFSKDPVGSQFLLDAKVNAGARAALAKLRGSGRPASPEEEQAAVADVLQANGVTPEPEEVSRQIALVDAPAAPPPSPQRAVEILTQMNDALPEPAVLRRVADEAQRPRPQHGPALAGARQAYAIARTALEKAQRLWGVKPADALAILGVETNYGKFTGNHPVDAVLAGELLKYPPGSPRYEQARRDRASLIKLQAAGELGGYTASSIKGSHGASFGYTQFRPSSWEAYARSPVGGRRNPFDMQTAAYSTAHYLHVHRYAQDRRRAFWYYNRDTAYVNKVDGESRRVESSVIAPAAATR